MFQRTWFLIWLLMSRRWSVHTSSNLHANVVHSSSKTPCGCCVPHFSSKTMRMFGATLLTFLKKLCSSGCHANQKEVIIILYYYMWCKISFALNTCNSFFRLCANFIYRYCLLYNSCVMKKRDLKYYRLVISYSKFTRWEICSRRISHQIPTGILEKR
jgi:hypothetical protein